MYLELEGREVHLHDPQPMAVLPPCRTPNYHMFVMTEPKGIKMDFEAAFTVHFIYIWVFFSSHEKGHFLLFIDILSLCPSFHTLLKSSLIRSSAKRRDDIITIVIMITTTNNWYCGFKSFFKRSFSPL